VVGRLGQGIDKLDQEVDSLGQEADSLGLVAEKRYFYLKIFDLIDQKRDEYQTSKERHLSEAPKLMSRSRCAALVDRTVAELALVVPE